MLDASSSFGEERPFDRPERIGPSGIISRHLRDHALRLSKLGTRTGSRVTIPLGAKPGTVKLELVVDEVWLLLPDIPVHTRSPQRRAGHAEAAMRLRCSASQRLAVALSRCRCASADASYSSTRRGKRVVEGAYPGQTEPSGTSCLNARRSGCSWSSCAGPVSLLDPDRVAAHAREAVETTVSSRRGSYGMRTQAETRWLVMRVISTSSVRHPLALSRHMSRAKQLLDRMQYTRLLPSGLR